MMVDVEDTRQSRTASLRSKVGRTTEKDETRKSRQSWYEEGCGGYLKLLQLFHSLLHELGDGVLRLRAIKLPALRGYMA